MSNTGQAFTRQSENSVYVAENPNPLSPTYLPIILKNH